MERGKQIERVVADRKGKGKQIETDNDHGVNGDVGDEFFNLIPAGYWFKPTDEELVVYYLAKKLSGEKLPPNRIREVELYLYHPQQLSETYKLLREEEWYFFTSTDKKYPNGSRPSRAANNGYWKAAASKTDIYATNGNQVGTKRSLVFCEGNSRSESEKTNWIMYEYKVELPTNNVPSTSKAPLDRMQLDKWVLCKMYQTKTKRTEKPLSQCKRKRDEDDEEMPVDTVPSNANHLNVPPPPPNYNSSTELAQLPSGLPNANHLNVPPPNCNSSTELAPLPSGLPFMVDAYSCGTNIPVMEEALPNGSCYGYDEAAWWRQ